MTKGHKRRGLEQRNFILPHSGGQTPELGGSAGLVPSGGSRQNLSEASVPAPGGCLRSQASRGSWQQHSDLCLHRPSPVSVSALICKDIGNRI